MIFNDWMSLIRIIVIAAIAYVGLIFILRISGNRTLSKMNSFDFIITISLGSTFATAILDKQISIADVLLAFIVLVGLQFMTTWLSVRSKRFDKLVKSDPILLFWNGEFLFNAMKDAHVAKDEILIGMRKQGFSSINDVGYVVLEASGEIVAVKKGDGSTLMEKSKD